MFVCVVFEAFLIFNQLSVVFVFEDTALYSAYVSVCVGAIS